MLFYLKRDYLFVINKYLRYFILFKAISKNRPIISGYFNLIIIIKKNIKYF